MADDSGTNGRRQVAVPIELYKIVTIFTTLIAVLAIVIGFLLIDSGTNRLRAPADEVNLVVTVAGVTMIALATVIYAFSTRFTPPERANDKGTSTEASDENG